MSLPDTDVDDHDGPSGAADERAAGSSATGPDRLADRFVAAVCRPSDVAAVQASVLTTDPDDLAGLVAAVDQHQPMTLEVVVDVLAGLGVEPSAVAEAMAVDVEDVVTMLAGPLGDRPAVRPDPGARIIEVAAPTEVAAPVEVATPAVVAEPVEVAEAVGVAEAEPPLEPRAEPELRADPESQPSSGNGDDQPDPRPAADDEPPEVTVRIDEVAEDAAVARTVADIDDPGDRRRRHAVWAVLAFLVVVAAVVAAVLLRWLPV